MTTRGVIYVAYGEQAREQVRLSVKTLLATNSRLPFRVVSDAPFEHVPRSTPIRHIYHEDTDPGARLVKLTVDQLSPFDLTLYLDADTRVLGDITWPFRVLEAGWEIAMCPGEYPPDEPHGHVNEEERQVTFAEIGKHPHVLQSGVLYFRKCPAVHELYREWRDEWHRWRDQDQAALVRALVRNPVRLFLLDRTYNHPQGRLVRHYCGFARRSGLKHSRADT